jgi:hypothetical protein
VEVKQEPNSPVKQIMGKKAPSSNPVGKVPTQSIKRYEGSSMSKLNKPTCINRATMSGIPYASAAGMFTSGCQPAVKLMKVSLPQDAGAPTSMPSVEPPPKDNIHAPEPSFQPATNWTSTVVSVGPSSSVSGTVVVNIIPVKQT